MPRHVTSPPIKKYEQLRCTPDSLFALREFIGVLAAQLATSVVKDVIWRCANSQAEFATVTAVYMWQRARKPEQTQRILGCSANNSHAEIAVVRKSKHANTILQQSR